jgi:hypothetical protein
MARLKEHLSLNKNTFRVLYKQYSRRLVNYLKPTQRNEKKVKHTHTAVSTLDNGRITSPKYHPAYPI